jgi:hypothetical protein
MHAMLKSGEPFNRGVALPPDPEDSDAPALRRAEASLPGRGRTIPPSLLHLRAPSPQRAFDTLEGSSCEAPSCGDPVSTAKTTLLPANHSFGTKKGLHSNERLDDRLDPMPTFVWSNGQLVYLNGREHEVMSFHR